MKKNLFFVFLVLFAISSSICASPGDPKKGSEKPTAGNPTENKLSAEEISRLSKRAETDNLTPRSLSNKEMNASKNNLKPPQEIYVGNNRHHGLYYGGAALILLIVLIVILV